jgi:dethiobiotin synthetase
MRRFSTFATVSLVESITVDDLDRQLTQCLGVDGRASFSAIAEVLGVSDQTVARRYRRLRSAGALRVVGLKYPKSTGYASWFLRLQCVPGSGEAIAAALAERGERVAVFKPAVSGLDAYREPGAEPDHALLRRAAGSDQADDEIAPYRFDPPVSPHLGAELAGERIVVERLLATARAAAARADFLVCEGVGGLLVPLTLRYLVRDLASDLGLPLVVVARPGLGTINHTLLTIEAARAAGIEVGRVVLTPWPDEPSAVERSNRQAIRRLGRVAVATLGQLDLRAPASWPPLPPFATAPRSAPAPGAS